MIRLDKEIETVNKQNQGKKGIFFYTLHHGYTFIPSVKTKSKNEEIKSNPE